MKAATNKGTCQLCGRVQRLPGGVLAKHGYTTKWGFFSGTCPGSDGLPFEQSTDLIEEAIANAERSAIDLRAQAKESREDLTAPIWMRLYVRLDRYRGRYEWKRVALEDIEGNGYHFDVKHDGKVYNVSVYAYGGREEGLTQLREERAKEREQQAAQRDEYVAWQRERMTGWKPADLLPL